MKILQQILLWTAKAVTIFFTVLTFGLVILSFVKPGWIESAIKWIGELITMLGNWNYLVAFLSACIESLPIIGTAVPGMNIMILVGGFWAREHFILTLLSAIVWAMLGNALGYWIGKTIGKEILDKYGDWIGIGKTEEKIFSDQLKKNGFWYIVLWKFHNFSRAFVPFLAGVGGMWLEIFGSIIWLDLSSGRVLSIFYESSFEKIIQLYSIILGKLCWYFSSVSVCMCIFLKKNLLRPICMIKCKK
jgi:membrane protein DedA with SNARE-associated domain